MPFAHALTPTKLTATDKRSENKRMKPVRKGRTEFATRNAILGPTSPRYTSQVLMTMLLRVTGVVLGRAGHQAGSPAAGGQAADRHRVCGSRAHLHHHPELQEEPQLRRARQVLRRRE